MLIRRNVLATVALTAVLGVVSVSCASGAGQVTYFDPAAVVLERIIPPPPAEGSMAERAELDEMLGIQAERTAAQVDRAQHDAKIGIFQLTEALGAPAELSAARLPRFVAFFDKVRDAEGAVVRSAKHSFDRKRPTEIEPRLKPVIDVPSSEAYPSGHATWAFAAAFVLADMVPEKRAAILTRATEFSNNRVVAGVHYRSDVEAGRICGSVLAAFLFASPEFRAEENLAAVELRTALKLPPLH